MLTSVSDTTTLSWLISCGVCQQLQENHEREPFFRSMFFGFSLLGCSKREVRGFLWEATSFLFCGRQRSPRAAAPSFVDEVAGEFETKLCCDDTLLSMLWLIFSFLSLLFFRFVCEKAKALNGPVDVISDERPEKLVRRTDDEVPQSYLPVAASTRTRCPASHCLPRMMY